MILLGEGVICAARVEVLAVLAQCPSSFLFFRCAWK